MLLSFLLIKKKNIYLYIYIYTYINICWDFPGGAVGKNPPTNAGDMGCVPDSGRSHVPEPQAAESLLHSKGKQPSACHNEDKPPLTATRGSPCKAMKTERNQKFSK